MKRAALVIALLVAVPIAQVASQSVRVRILISGSAVQAQAPVLNAGDIVIRLSGNCGGGFTEVTDLDGVFPIGTLAANANQGGTGGANDITPAGVVAAPTFTGSALGGHAHATGTFATSAHSGTAVDDHASHTHTYTDVVNHVHLVEGFPTATGGSTGFTRDTSMSGTPANTSQNTANPTGGVATGTTAGPGAVLTHAVTQPSAHTLSGSSESVSAGTPAGTNSAPTFTGTQFDNRPSFRRVIFCAKD